MLDYRNFFKPDITTVDLQTDGGSKLGSGHNDKHNFLLFQQLTGNIFLITQQMHNRNVHNIFKPIFHYSPVEYSPALQSNFRVHTLSG